MRGDLEYKGEVAVTNSRGSAATPVVVLARDDVGRGIPQKLSDLLSYLQSWRTENGLSGFISTWWSSAVDTVAPHPMNQAPVVQLLVRLTEIGVAGNWLEWARSEGDALLRNISDQGLLKNGWGDLPGRPLAPVIGFSGAGALFALAQKTEDHRYLDGAERIMRGYERSFAEGNRLYHAVANQSARWAMALLQRHIVTGDEAALLKAHAVISNLFEEVLKTGPLKGAIHQGGNDDTLINVYVGKCLYPLFAVAKFTEDTKLKELGLQASHYICDQAFDENGALKNYYHPSGSLYRGAQIASSALRRLLGSQRNIKAVRRRFISNWQCVEFPIFVARSADTIRGLRVAADLDPSLSNKVRTGIDFLLAHQRADGGIVNSIKYMGEFSRPSWQDCVSVNRWNAYTAQLLTEMLPLGVEPGRSLPPAMVKWGEKRTFRRDSADYQLQEDKEFVVGKLVEGEKESLCWRVDKRKGLVDVVCSDWYGELTGPRMIGDLK